MCEGAGGCGDVGGFVCRLSERWGSCVLLRGFVWGSGGVGVGRGGVVGMGAKG